MTGLRSVERGSSSTWCRCLLGMTLLVVNDGHCPQQTP